MIHVLKYLSLATTSSLPWHFLVLKPSGMLCFQHVLAVESTGITNVADDYCDQERFADSCTMRSPWRSAVESAKRFRLSWNQQRSISIIISFQLLESLDPDVDRDTRPRRRQIYRTIKSASQYPHILRLLELNSEVNSNVSRA